MAHRCLCVSRSKQEAPRSFSIKHQSDCLFIPVSFSSIASPLLCSYLLHFFHVFSEIVNQLKLLKIPGSRINLPYGWIVAFLAVSVVEAVEVRNGNKRNGKHVRCAHKNPQGDPMSDYAPHPAIVLKVKPIMYQMV
ncbi:unnamed protein product [Lactuca saligna]|uniref:Uncharacterized protein n=1 Tax=Lactuca saligna TaxID=75948 RepID=A0AA35VAD4_LACSI|nr:unnamed protein product [Lactuca saligna]